MRKQIMLLMLSIILVFTFSACSGCNETSGSAEQEESPASSEEKAEEGAGSENSSSEEQGETTEPETGNFDGLDVQDETTIDIEEGQSVVVE